MKVIDRRGLPRGHAKISDIKIDSSFIARRSELPLIKGYCGEATIPRWYEPQLSRHPHALAYYECNASEDPGRRIYDTVEASPCRPHFGPPVRDAYSEEGTRTRYLESRPVCYAVLGKPGLETERLAEAIACARNCVLISASRIQREIEAAAAPGCGCDAGVEATWDAMMQRASARDVAHRGYVLEGLPLIRRKPSSPETTASQSSVTDPCGGDKQPTGEYVVVTLHDAAPWMSSSNSTTMFEAVDAQESKHLEESVTSSDKSSSVRSESIDTAKSLCSMISTKNFDAFRCPTPSASSSKTPTGDECSCSSGTSACSKCQIFEQLEHIFIYWKLKPDVIVQLTCPDDEVLAKYKKCFCDTASSVENVERDSDSSDIVFDKSVEKLFDDVDSLTNAKNFHRNLEYQLDIYARYAAEFIEKVIISHNPQNVICIDGRYPIEHNIETVKIRLQILPLQIAIVPEKMKLPSDLSDSSEGESKDSMDEGAEYENDYFEVTDESVDLNLVFEKIKRYEIISDVFEWKLSRWKFLCPVELAKGKKIEGKRKHIVRFMNLIFFLSSNEAMETFIDNPRPYLLPPNPRPSCKIAVIGPRYSGKTKLSFDLANDFDSTVINVGNIVDCLSQNFQKIDIKNKIKTLSSNESVRSDNLEILNEIVRCIENLPEQDCGDFTRNKGFILDDINLDFDFCKKLLENDISIETVVILFESDPFTELINRWNERESRISCENKEMFDNSFEDNESFVKSCYSVSDFISDLRYFNSNCKYVANKLEDIGVEVILCDIDNIEDIGDHVISKIRQKYYHSLTPMEIYEDLYEENEYESTEDAESQVPSTQAQEEAFHLGDFKHYCPIAMLEHNTIWKGKEKYGCMLGDKMYYMSSESAWTDFQKKYMKLPLPLERPFKLPRLKIFIVGPPGSGKSVLSECISGELGLTNIDFYKRFEGYMHDRGIDVRRIKLHVNKENFEDESVSSSETEFNFPEDLNSLYYKYDSSTITNLYFKYKKESTKLPTFLINECLFNFFAAPFNAYGVVVNTFPNYISDCEMMLNNFLIPDIIIELKLDFRIALGRALKDLIQEWKLEQKDLKLEEEARFSEELYCYYEKKEKWMKHEQFKRYREKKMELDKISERSDEFTLYSDCTSLSEIHDYLTIVTEEDERELNESFKKEHPKPKRFTEWETEEAARERFAIQIEQEYENSLQHISFLENYFKSQTIPWVKLDTDASEDLVCKKLLYILIPYYRRNASFFEKTFEIDNVIAENLLASGYYFLSSFGRYCPVQAYNQKIPFQIFLPKACQGRTFSVLHRQYIYFLVGREAVEAFKKDPLKYIDQDSHIPLIPAIISVIGPPLSGKTTLSKRFASTYGFETISRDEVINYVLCNFPLINLSANIRKKFQNGEPVSTEQFVAVVKLFLSNSQCITQGCIFDGFPASIEEATVFNSHAISPLIIVDLQISLEYILQNLENNENLIFSNPYIYRRCEEWNADAEQYRNWLNDYFGNVVKIDAMKISASVWKQADEQVRYRFNKFLQYVREAGYDKPHNLQYLRLKPWELQKRISRFRLFCPGCIHFNDDFNSFNISKGRKGLYQFREYFYWFCKDHVDIFKKNPEKFLRNLEYIRLPKCYPEIIHDTVDVKNYCWANRLVNKGFCLVTYIDNLPRRKLKPGDPSLGVLLDDKLYLLCSLPCRERFCRKFCKYANWKIFFPKTLKPLDVQKLPLLGFLEQGVAKAIANAANYVSTQRPKLPGLSSTASAAVFLGAHLKTQLSNGEAPYFSKVLTRMEGRCEFLNNILGEMKKRLNPWLYYEEEEEEDDKQCSVQKIGGVKSISCFHDPLQVKFTRTSPTPWVESLQSVVTKP